jgi:4-hydroxybenzoate polyprenyltransferase
MWDTCDMFPRPDTLRRGLLQLPLHWRSLLTHSRPRFWLYLLGPVLIGMVVGFGTTATSSFWRWDLLATVLYFTFPANFLIYLVNDWFDADTDLHNTKKDEYESRLSPERAESAMVMLVIVLVLTLLLALGLPSRARLFLLGFVGLGLAYSVPPLRLKMRPFLDGLSNVLYALPGFVAFALLSDAAIGWEVGAIALSWNAAMHGFSALPDIEADRRADLQTTAVLFGPHGMAQYVAGLWVFAAGVALLGWGVWALPMLVYPAVAGVVAMDSEPISRSWELYRYFPWINGLIGMYVFWAAVWQLGLVW